MKFVYFPVMGRGLAINLALEHHNSGKYETELHTMETWPAKKPTTTFGQLPLLETDDVGEIAQSLAILSYIGRKFDADGKTLKEKTAADMAVGLGEDIFTALAKTHPTVLAPVKGTEEEIKAMFVAIAGLTAAANKFLGDKDRFTDDGVAVGELHFFAILYQLVHVKADALDATPSLKKFYERVLALPATTAVLEGKSSYGKQTFYFELPKSA